jgi:hypothetical protein
MWFRNIVNEEALARWGLSRQKITKHYNITRVLHDVAAWCQYTNFENQDIIKQTHIYSCPMPLSSTFSEFNISHNDRNRRKQLHRLYAVTIYNQIWKFLTADVVSLITSKMAIIVRRVSSVIDAPWNFQRAISTSPNCTMTVFLLHMFTNQRMIIPYENNLKPWVYLQANDIKYLRS